MADNEIKKLIKALAKSQRDDYEKLRAELIKKHGYDKFRDLQSVAFRNM